MNAMILPTLAIALLGAGPTDYTRLLDAKHLDQPTLDAEGFGDKKGLTREDDGLRIKLAVGGVETGWKTPQNVRFGGDFTLTIDLQVKALPKPAGEDGAAFGVALAFQDINQPDLTFLRLREPNGQEVYRWVDKGLVDPMQQQQMMMQRQMIMMQQGMMMPGAKPPKPPRKTFPTSGESAQIELKREGNNIQIQVNDPATGRQRYLGKVYIGPNDIAGIKLFASNRNGAEPVDVVVKRLDIKAGRLYGLGTAIRTVFEAVTYGEPTGIEDGKLLIGDAVPGQGGPPQGGPMMPPNAGMMVPQPGMEEEDGPPGAVEVEADAEVQAQIQEAVAAVQQQGLVLPPGAQVMVAPPQVAGPPQQQPVGAPGAKPNQPAAPPKPPKAKIPLDEVESIRFERAIAMSGRFMGQSDFDFTGPHPKFKPPPEEPTKPAVTNWKPFIGTIASGQSMATPDGVYTLAMLDDGNLVERGPGGSILFASNTAGNPGAAAVMQDDGNLVVYSKATKALWSTETGGKDNLKSVLMIHPDGRMTIDQPSGKTIWESRPAAKKDEPKPEAAVKKDAPKNDGPKAGTDAKPDEKEKPKQEEPKKAESEPKPDEMKKEVAVAKEEPKKAEAKPDDAKKEVAVTKEEPKKADAKPDEAKKADAKPDEAKKADAKPDEPKKPEADDPNAPPPGTAAAPKIEAKVEAKKNGIRDIVIALAGLRPAPIQQVTVNCQTDKGPTTWQIDTTGTQAWPLIVRRSGVEAWAELYLEPPHGDCHGKDFTVMVMYRDGQNGNAQVKSDKHSDAKLAVDPKAPAAPRADSWLHLAGGEKMYGKVDSIGAESVKFTTPWQDHLDIPLSRVVGIKMNQIEAKESPESFARRLKARGSEDLLLAKTKDGEVIAIAGILEGSSDDRLLFGYQGKTRKLPIEMVEGLVMAARPEPDQPDAARATFDLPGGVAVTGRWKGLTPEKWKVETPWGQDVDLPAADVQAVKFRGGRVTYLSDLEPSKVEETPFFGRAFPYKRDVSLLGGPLKLDGSTYDRGLAVHSRTSLTFDLNRRYATFEALVGFDEASKGKGRVDCRVFADGKEIYANPDLRADGPAITLKLPVEGAEQLRLLIDFGKGQDTGDRVIWANARVTRK